MRVAVDAMGGDNAPAIEVEGAVAAAREFGIQVILVGDSGRLHQELAKHDCKGLNISVKHASEVIGMRFCVGLSGRKRTLHRVFDLGKWRGDVNSAGNSGATIHRDTRAKRLRIERPAIATIFPTLRGKTLVLDVGGNVDCKSVHLVQFAIMGEVYARYIMDVDTPKVGLLSNGEEASKGNELTRETNSILQNASFNYSGMLKAVTFQCMVDVVVCDGFVGNVVLKLSEGLVEAAVTMLKDEIKQSFLSKVGYLLARSAFKNFKKKVDYSEYGGAPLLGIDGVAMICHGGSNAKAVKNAIHFAHDYALKGVNQKMAEKLQCNFAVTMQP
jgi:glycerol-3-phosphate acyltransferase PlsX